jgi:hypothetical protein
MPGLRAPNSNVSHPRVGVTVPGGEATAARSPHPSPASEPLHAGGSSPGAPGGADVFLDFEGRGTIAGSARAGRPELAGAEPAQAPGDATRLRGAGAALLGAGLGLGAAGVGYAAFASLGTLGAFAALGLVGAAAAPLATLAAGRRAASPSPAPAGAAADEARGPKRRRGFALEPDLRPHFRALQPVPDANLRVLDVARDLVVLARESPDPRARAQLLALVQDLTAASDRITAALEEAAKI